MGWGLGWVLGLELAGIRHATCGMMLDGHLALHVVPRDKRLRELREDRTHAHIVSLHIERDCDNEIEAVRAIKAAGLRQWD